MLNCSRVIIGYTFVCAARSTDRLVVAMKRAPINRISQKQRRELTKRRKLKQELLRYGPHDEFGNPLCKHCGGYPDFRGLQLVHLDPIGMGGSTTATNPDNCEIWCALCHFGPDGHQTENMQGLD